LAVRRLVDEHLAREFTIDLLCHTFRHAAHEPVERIWIAVIFASWTPRKDASPREPSCETEAMGMENNVQLTPPRESEMIWSSSSSLLPG
jgi:hypothetical protein